MKKTLPLTLALCLLSLSAFAQQGEAELKAKTKKFRNNKRFVVKYDKFKDQTLVTVGPFMITGTTEYMVSSTMIGIMAGFNFKGQQLKDPAQRFSIGIDSTSKEWQFLRSRATYVIADGERFELGEASHTSRVGRGSVREFLEIYVTADQFAKIADAKSVEMKVGYREFKLKEEHTQAFKDLYSLAQLQE